MSCMSTSSCDFRVDEVLSGVLAKLETCCSFVRLSCDEFEVKKGEEVEGGAVDEPTVVKSAMMELPTELEEEEMDLGLSPMLLLFFESRPQAVWFFMSL